MYNDGELRSPFRERVLSVPTLDDQVTYRIDGTSVKLGILPISINDILEAFKSCLRIDSG